MSYSNEIEHTLRDLVIANRILAREDVIDDFGHVSVRHPTDKNRFFLSRSRSPQNVTRDDLMEFSLDGTAIGDDKRRPYAERFIHGSIYEARPDVNSVSHHHARSVIPFSVSNIPLRPIFHMGSVAGAEIPVWDSQAEFGDTNMLIDSLEMGNSLARTLGDGSAALLRGHGAVCAAPNIRAICLISINMKLNAEMLLQALPLGIPQYLSAGEIKEAASMLLSDMPLARAWDYWTTRAGFAGL